MLHTLALVLIIVYIIGGRQFINFSMELLGAIVLIGLALWYFGG